MTASARPLRRDAERNRARVLDAAREVFAVRGSGATLEEVARTAGVGIGTVYRRFPTRGALVQAVFDRHLAELLELAEQCRAEPDPWTGLAVFLRRAVAEHLLDRGLREVLLADAAGDDRLSRAVGALSPRVELILERAKAAGAVRPDLGLGDLTMTMLGVATVADHTRHAGGSAWRRYQELVLEGLRPGAVPGPLPPAALSEPEVDRTVRTWAAAR